MKKLMIAAAAAVCGSVFALESANVVGYQEQTMNASGATMAAATFMNVTAADGSFKLSDLKVTGYDAPVYDEDEGELLSGGVIKGAFSLQILNASGATEANYYWVDNGEIGPGWFDMSNKSCNSVALASGQGMWIMGNGLTLMPAGSVNLSDVSVVTRATGATASGNSTPAALTLGDLVVSGYDAPVYDEDEGELLSGGVIKGAFSFQFLTTSGTTEANYYWVDNGEIGPGWFDMSNKNCNSVALPAGKGAWIMGSGLTLTIPAPEM